MSGSAEDAAARRGASVDGLVREAESKLTLQSQEVQAAPDPVAKQRDWIGKVIIYLFAGAVGLGLVLMLLEGLFAADKARADVWKDVATQSADLIKSAVLPVVTLVLGYYFGQASRT